MGDSETGQVSEDAAKIYETVYLPALFQEWCLKAMDAAKIKSGDCVLDVACGTGALTMAIAEHVGTYGKTIGIDINEGMLNIARSKSALVAWLNAAAEALPFADDYFHCVTSQFGLMYFEDQETGLKEMMRVLKPGGTIVVVVWDALDNNPGLAAEELLWHQVFGEDIEEAPYRLGDKHALKKLLKASGISDFQIHTENGTARFDSIKSWIHTGAKGWTEDEALNEAELRLLLDIAETELTRFRTKLGKVEFPTSAHIVTATK